MPEFVYSGCEGVALDSMISVLKTQCHEQGIKFANCELLPLKDYNGELVIWYLDEIGRLYYMTKDSYND